MTPAPQVSNSAPDRYKLLNWNFQKSSTDSTLQLTRGLI
jgi:hypothetical protein